MERRTFLKLSGGSLAASLFSQSVLGEWLQANPWQIKMLTNEIGVFTERGGTILFYVSKEGIAVIDTQFPEQANHLQNELKKNTVPVTLLINTHHHLDHTSGNPVFKSTVQQLIAHENSKINQQKVAEQRKNVDQQFFPTLTFKDTLQQEFGNEKIKFHYFGPAHTNGDALIHFERANIVHMGDLMNNRRYPYIDASAGASIKNWIVVLEKAVKTFGKKATYVYGHASTGFEVYGKYNDVHLMRDYFSALLNFMEKEIKAGKSKEEILKTTSIPGVTEWVGEGIQRSLTAAYDELTK